MTLPFPNPLKWIWDMITGIFKRPKKNDPEDVAERNRQMREFCDMVNASAKQTEEAVVKELEHYAKWLSYLSQSDEYEFLKRYRVQTRGFMRQIEFASAQIPGLIASEVSKHLSEANPDFQRVRHMLPGAEKERVMREFMERIIREATDKSAELCERILEDIQEDFTLLLEESLEQSRTQLEKKEQELTEAMHAVGDTTEQTRIEMRAKQINACCGLVEELLQGV